MSSLLFVCLALSITYTVVGRYTPEQIDQLGKACNASEDDLTVAKAYKVPTSETGKCLMKCMINKLGMLNDDGTYNKNGTEDALRKYWSEWANESITQINNQCYDEAKLVSPDVITTCNYAYEVMACLNKQAKLLGVL